MPFPFIVAIGGAIATAVGTTTAVVGTTVAAAAATTAAAVSVGTAVAVGAAVLGGVVVTKAIIENNKEARRRAFDEAKKKASREREKEILKEKAALDKKKNALIEEYGENIPHEKKEKFLLESSTVLGELEGNKVGLVAQGQKPSSDAEAALQELTAFQEQSGISK